MNTNNNIMIDIETTSTNPDAAIVSIGAIRFARGGKLRKIGDMDSFYTKVSISSCEDVGLHTDPSTMDWWSRQDQSVRYEALENPTHRLSIHDALRKLAEWIGRGDNLIWGNGDDFDCVILASAYRACGINVPWKFWNTRDVRTVFDLGGVKPWDLPTELKHHPVHDCWRQIWGLQRSFGVIGMYQDKEKDE